MLSFTKSLIATALLGAAIVRAQSIIDLSAAVAIGDSAVCPIPDPATVNAQVLAVVQFDETVSVQTLGLPLANVRAAVNVCLCVDATVQTGIPISASVGAAAIAPIRAGILVDTDPLLGPITSALGLGNSLTIVGQPTPGTVQQTCQCAAGSRPICSNGVCGCDPCPAATPLYDPTTQTCVACPTGQTFSTALQACVLPPSPGARKARRTALQPEIERRQATRDSIVNRRKA